VTVVTKHEASNFILLANVLAIDHLKKVCLTITFAKHFVGYFVGLSSPNGKKMDSVVANTLRFLLAVESVDTEKLLFLTWS
jgi:hypothetical protein